MRKYLLSLLLCLFVVVAPATVNPIYSQTGKYAHQTEQKVFVAGAAICSATAIGPQALLTATHCEMPTEELWVRGYDFPAHIVGRMRDGNDHTIYLLQDIHFADYADVLLTSLQAGEDIFYWGNPGEWKDQLRKGYVSGFQVPEETLESIFGVPPGPTMVYFDIRTWKGDSGAGVFNSDGKLVLVISVCGAPEMSPSDGFIPGPPTFAGGFVLGYTQKDLDYARTYSKETRRNTTNT